MLQWPTKTRQGPRQTALALLHLEEDITMAMSMSTTIPTKMSRVVATIVTEDTVSTTILVTVARATVVLLLLLFSLFILSSECGEAAVDALVGVKRPNGGHLTITNASMTMSAFILLLVGVEVLLIPLNPLMFLLILPRLQRHQLPFIQRFQQLRYTHLCSAMDAAQNPS